MRYVTNIHLNRYNNSVEVFTNAGNPFYVSRNAVDKHIPGLYDYLANNLRGRRFSTLFRSREAGFAAYLLFKHLAKYPLHESLCDGLSRCLQAELRGHGPLSRNSDSLTAGVFTTLCAMLQRSGLDCSESLFHQLGAFLVNAFDRMTDDDPTTSAKCLLALDSLRRPMRPVLRQLARRPDALEIALDEEPALSSYLRASTMSDIDDLLNYNDRDPIGAWRRPRHHHRRWSDGNAYDRRDMARAYDLGEEQGERNALAAVGRANARHPGRLDVVHHNRLRGYPRDRMALAPGVGWQDNELDLGQRGLRAIGRGGPGSLLDYDFDDSNRYLLGYKGFPYDDGDSESEMDPYPWGPAPFIQPRGGLGRPRILGRPAVGAMGGIPPLLGQN